MLLNPGDTCWRTAKADRLALLMDNEDYFEALAAALPLARKSILLIGWQFDPRTRLRPQSVGRDHAAEIGFLLRRMARERPELEIRLLIWRSPLLIAVSQGFFPQKAVRWFDKNAVNFRLDRARPLGGCHHQKVLVIDDVLAFTGGGDISVDRWDTPDHDDRDPRRCTPTGRICPPRHEVMAMLDGPAARALGDLARERWEEATGHALIPTDGVEPIWPEGWTPMFKDVDIGIARTEPEWRDGEEIRESEKLHLAGIAAAKRLIYLENQYFTSPVIAEALARRLEEPDGPEVVVVSTARAPSWFDHAVMDAARRVLIRRLRRADVHGRLSLWTPVTTAGSPIIVHSKVTAIDDRMLRVGSTNLNNRSCGFDTEVDIAWEAEWEGDDVSLAIHAFRSRLVGHFLGVEGDEVGFQQGELGSLGAAMQALNTRRRMRGLDERPPGAMARFIAEWQIGDPSSTRDAWRPWRRARLSRRLRETVAHAEEAAASDHQAADAAATASPAAAGLAPAGSISKSTINGK